MDPLHHSQESTPSKYLSPPLNLVLECVVNVEKFIKIQPLKARFFKKLCEDMRTESTSLLYYCKLAMTLSWLCIVLYM